MKNILSALIIFLSFSVTPTVYASQLNSNSFAFETNAVIFAGTNLNVFGPPYEAKALADVPAMLSTNGIKCWANILYDPPVCYVYIYNYTTNYMACLKMPSTNLCRMALLDKKGHQVEKTDLGTKYGLPISQAQIDWQRNHWTDPHQSIFLKLIPNGLPKYDSVPTEICNFNINDVFKIKAAGEYELHLQVRVIQVGTDRAGKFYYPATWLPEIVNKIEISAKDVPAN